MTELSSNDSDSGSGGFDPGGVNWENILAEIEEEDKYVFCFNCFIRID